MYIIKIKKKICTCVPEIPKLIFYKSFTLLHSEIYIMRENWRYQGLEQNSFRHLPAPLLIWYCRVAPPPGEQPGTPWGLRRAWLYGHIHQTASYTKERKKQKGELKIKKKHCVKKSLFGLIAHLWVLIKPKFQIFPKCCNIFPAFISLQYNLKFKFNK